jgi:hypothetical protein
MPPALASPPSHSALASDFVLSDIVVDEDPPPREEVQVHVQSFLQDAKVKMANAPKKINFFIEIIFSASNIIEFFKNNCRVKQNK